MPKIKLSLKPVAEALEREHAPSGATFLIAPLSGERDNELTREHTDLYGNLNAYAFGLAVCQECIKGWKGVGDAGAGTEAACNPENIAEFYRNHATTIGPWILRQTRTIEHYRVQEIAAAKNG